MARNMYTIKYNLTALFHVLVNLALNYAILQRSSRVLIKRFQRVTALSVTTYGYYKNFGDEFQFIEILNGWTEK